MVKLSMNILGIEIDFEISYKRSEKCKCENETPINESNEEMPDIRDNGSEQLTFFDDLNNDELEQSSPIYELAEQYRRDLEQTGTIYEIPYSSDLPTRKSISDDVEIITDRFEKEIEDIIEGRR